MRPVETGKQKKELGLPASAVEDLRLHTQGVQMIFMFPLVMAVTLLLAIGEVAKIEERRNRFNVAR